MIYTHQPVGCAKPSIMLVFHGSGRSADNYRDRARSFADRSCMLVVAPLFDKERYPNWAYQRGGIVHDDEVLPPEEWTVSQVDDLVEWARKRVNRPDAPYYLFGHSAGGQFLSRVAAFALPRDAERIVISNPSSYVVASLDEPAPYGLGGVFDEDEAEDHLRAYLELPITIYLGDEDTGDEDLHNSEEALRQGENRLERGENVFHEAQELAEANGWNFGWELVKAPDVGHSSEDMLNSEAAGEAFGFDHLD